MLEIRQEQDILKLIHTLEVLEFPYFEVNYQDLSCLLESLLHTYSFLRVEFVIINNPSNAYPKISIHVIKSDFYEVVGIFEVTPHRISLYLPGWSTSSIVLSQRCSKHNLRESALIWIELIKKFGSDLKIDKNLKRTVRRFLSGKINKKKLFEYVTIRQALQNL
ncbi:MAG: hypothetical protein DRZ76_01805 [Candidatus Nealsonbacteria bacterium]|nr:MAG: hypothetical protein DRZ76_01805 [Candidatus Nealsonbacteria bacterium]